MNERERVRRAVEDQVESAAKLLDEAADADLEARLTMLISGWGRAIAAGLEELAIGLEEIRRSSSTPEATKPDSATEPTLPRKRREPAASERDRAPEEDEERLRNRAEESRAATAAVREQASIERDDEEPTSSQT